MSTTEEVQEVFRDHLEECLEHFRKWFNSKMPKGTRGRHEAMKPLVDFCGVGQQTAQCWLDNDLESPLPRGDTLFKLMCYLDLHGYKVIEFERMPKVLRNFAELIGFGVLSPQQAFELVGYCDTSSLYQVLYEKEGVGKQKKERMLTIWKERRDQLEAKKREAFKSRRLKILFKSAPKTNQIEQQISVISEPAPNYISLRSATLNIFGGVLTLLDEGLFEELSPGELENLKNTHSNTILQLSAYLSALSSKLITIEKGGR